MSSLMAVTVRLVKRDFPDVIFLVTYADLEHHTGKVYEAAGWGRDGERKGHHKFLASIDGVAVSYRTLWDYHKTENMEKLIAIYGPRISFRPTCPKRRYVKWLK